MNPYAAMSDELEKLSLGPKARVGLFAAGVAGTAGAGVFAQRKMRQIQARRRSARSAAHEQAYQAMSPAEQYAEARSVFPEAVAKRYMELEARPAHFSIARKKQASIEKDAIGLMIAGLAARAATKFGPKLLKGTAHDR